MSKTTVCGIPQLAIPFSAASTHTHTPHTPHKKNPIKLFSCVIYLPVQRIMYYCFGLAVPNRYGISLQ